MFRRASAPPGLVSCRSRAGVGSDHGKRPAVERVQVCNGKRTCVNDCRRIVGLGKNLSLRDSGPLLGVAREMTTVKASIGALRPCNPQQEETGTRLMANGSFYVGHYCN